MLQLHNFHAGIKTKEILHGIDLQIKPGEVHAIMGPNGSGKTTLAMSLMGHPSYNSNPPAGGQNAPTNSIRAGSRMETTIGTNSKYQINGKDMTNLLPEERARAGLFVSFQSPIEITGVSLLAFLRTAAKSLNPDEKKPLAAFKEEVKNALKAVSLNELFMQRSVNEGFSGGERKRAEITQLFVLKPRFAILDEIDSGLDVDSLKIVAQAVQQAVKKQNLGVLIITHYQRILHFLKPDKVHVLIDGKIAKTGGMSLVRKIEKEGYAAI